MSHRPLFRQSANLTQRTVIVVLTAAIIGFTAGICPAGQIPTRSAIGSTGITVQPAFGGTILGFDIDPNGNLGLLSEFTFKPDGAILAATEIFDQATAGL